MTDQDGKEHRYSISKDIGIDISIIPSTVVAQLQVTKVTTTPQPKNTQSNKPTNSRIGSTRLANIKDAPSGSSRNAEYEIRDGKGNDDPDEQWKRNNGYKM